MKVSGLLVPVAAPQVAGHHSMKKCGTVEQTEWPSMGSNEGKLSYALQEIEEYARLLDDLEGSAKRWQDWMDLERPENEPFPGLTLF